MHTRHRGGSGLANVVFNEAMAEQRGRVYSPFSGSNFPPFSIPSLKEEAGRMNEPSALVWILFVMSLICETSFVPIARRVMCECKDNCDLQPERLRGKRARVREAGRR